MRRKLIFLFLFLICIKTCFGVIINEIMYNPEGDEYDFEYIELYGENENISNWYFEGIDFTFPVNTTINGYLAIANTLNSSGENNDFLDRYPDINCTVEYSGSLLNTGETIIIRDNEGKIIDIVTYGAWSEENHSIERKDANSYSTDPDNWAQSINGGTPGKENSVRTSLNCDWQLSVITNNTASQNVEWQIRASKINGEGKTNITIKQWIEDSYGSTLKTYSDINMETVSQSTSGKYSPTLEIGNAYFVKANITKISCEDNKLENNFISEMIFIRNDEQNITSDSNIEIKDSIKNPVKFGETLNLDINVYRGNTSKYAVYYYLQESPGKLISEKMTMHFKDRFTNYSLRIPLQIDPNCNEKYNNGSYNLIVDGLNTKAEKEIYIEGLTDNLCQKIEVEKETVKKESKGTLSYDIIEAPSTVYLNQSFDIILKIGNDYDEDVSLEVWSYIYRGNKKYSEEKENMKYITIDSAESREVTLKNIITEAEEGTYNLKVKVLKKGRKTTYDKTMEIYLKVPEYIKEKEEKQETLAATDKKQEKELENKKEIINRKNEVIYESDTFLTKKLIPLFLTALFLISILFSIINFKKSI